MKPPSTTNTPTPLELHEKIKSQYKPLPPKANTHKLVTIVIVTIIVLTLIIIPIAETVDKKSASIIYYFTIPISLFVIFNAYREFLEEYRARDLEINLRNNIKNKFIRMQLWYEKEEPLYRNHTKQSSRSIYPCDWCNRKEYIEARDGACYLCGKASNNHSIYQSMPYKKRITGMKRKDINKFQHIHHIVPISKGGSHALSNLILLCGECHAKQHNHMKSR